MAYLVSTEQTKPNLYPPESWSPLHRPHWRCKVLADLPFHAEFQPLNTGAVDNNAGPNLGPLVWALLHFHGWVCQDWRWGKKSEKCSQIQQFSPLTFLGPHELMCFIPGKTFRAGCSIFFVKSSIRCLCSSWSFFISDNILLMDKSMVSCCLSETCASTIFAVSWLGLRHWRWDIWNASTSVAMARASCTIPGLVWSTFQQISASAIASTKWSFARTSQTDRDASGYACLTSHWIACPSSGGDSSFPLMQLFSCNLKHFHFPTVTKPQQQRAPESLAFFSWVFVQIS